MKQDIQLSTGRIVSHRPYLSAGEPNGATEAYMQDGGEMSDAEWAEYVRLSAPAPKRKPTWQDIKTAQTHIGIDLAVPGQDRAVKA